MSAGGIVDVFDSATSRGKSPGWLIQRCHPPILVVIRPTDRLIATLPPLGTPEHPVRLSAKTGIRVEQSCLAGARDINRVPNLPQLRGGLSDPLTVFAVPEVGVTGGFRRRRWCGAIPAVECIAKEGERGSRGTASPSLRNCLLQRYAGGFLPELGEQHPATCVAAEGASSPLASGPPEVWSLNDTSQPALTGGAGERRKEGPNRQPRRLAIRPLTGLSPLPSQAGCASSGHRWSSEAYS